MKKYRKNIRLKHYNYTSNGYYFVTVCTRKFFPFLKFIKGEVEKCISNLPQFISGLTVDYFVVMDNHIHIIFTQLQKNVAGELLFAQSRMVMRPLQGEK